jgi:putative hydrolase of the HAD superfamily
MLPFDVILFDVGGVLLTNGWDYRERAAAVERFGLDAAAFEARHLAAYDAWERSAISGKTYLNETVFYEPREFSRGDFFSFMLAQSKLLPGGALEINRHRADDEKNRAAVAALEQSALMNAEFAQKLGASALHETQMRGMVDEP